MEHAKRFNICMIGIPEGIKRENGPEAILEEIMS